MKRYWWILVVLIWVACGIVLGLCNRARAEEVGFLNIVSVTFRPDHFCPEQAGEVDIYLRAQPELPHEETTLRVILPDGQEITRVISATTQESHQLVSFTAPANIGYFCVNVSTSRPSDGQGDYVSAWSYVALCSSLSMTGKCVRGCTNGCVNLTASGVIAEEQRWVSVSGTGINGELVFLYESGGSSFYVFLDGRYPLIPIRGPYQRVTFVEGIYTISVWPGNFESGPDFEHLLAEASTSVQCDWPTQTPTASPTPTATKTVIPTHEWVSPTPSSTPRNTSTLRPTATPRSTSTLRSTSTPTKTEIPTHQVSLTPTNTVIPLHRWHIFFPLILR